MTSPRRFMWAWILATVPATWLGYLGSIPLVMWLAPTLLRDAGTTVFWTLLVCVQIGVTLVAALLQSRVLDRHRRRVRGWVWAEVAAHVTAYLLYLSMTRGMAGVFTALLATGGSARILWILIFGTSWALTFGVAEAFALWGRRWPPSWILWLAGRIVVSLVLSAGIFALNQSPEQQASTGFQAILQLANHLASAAATAWLLDRAVFQPEAAYSVARG